MTVAAEALKHVWFHATSPQALRAEGGLTVFNKGEGCYLIDEDGRRYLDGLSGGAFVTNVGHGRAEIADAMAAQARELAYVSPYNFVAPATVKLAGVVADLAPGDLERVFFTSFRPGTMVAYSVRIYSDFRHRRLAISAPSSMRRPFRVPS